MLRNKPHKQNPNSFKSLNYDVIYQLCGNSGVNISKWTKHDLSNVGKAFLEKKSQEVQLKHEDRIN